MPAALPSSKAHLAGLAPLALVAGLALSSAPSLAQESGMGVWATSTATAFDQPPSSRTETLNRAGAVSAAARAGIEDGGMSGSAWSTAWGAVGTGHMQLQTVGGATLSGTGTIGEVSTAAEASAHLADTFLITCPSCVAGTQATVTFVLVAQGDLFVDGSLSGTPQGLGSRFSAYASAFSGFSMGAPDVEFPGEPVLDGLFKSESYTSFGSDSHDRPVWRGAHTASFTMGDPLSFSWEALVRGQASAGNFDEGNAMTADAAFNTNFSTGFYWGGIYEVRDSSGNLLTGITALNGAGVDYARALAPPVPEPSTALLATLGALLLLVVAPRAGHWRRPA